MKYRKITAALAATFMITAVLASLGAVSADHTQSSEWTATGSTSMETIAGKEMVTSITVTNNGPDAIDNLSIVFPSVMDPHPAATVPADNVFDLEDPDNIILPAGTVVSVSESVSVSISENTEFIRLKGTELWNLNAEDNVELLENAWLKVPTSSTDTTLPSDVEVKGGADKELTLETHDNVRLLNDTRVINSGGNLTLPEDTEFEVVAADNASGLVSGDNVMLNTDNILTLTDNQLVATEELKVKTNDGYTQYITEGTTVELSKDNDVLGTAGTEFQLNAAENVELAENTDVIREAYTEITPQTSGAVENQPVGWTQENGASSQPSGDYVEWTDNEIASGSSEDFPVALTAPSTGGTYTVYVYTTDTSGLTKKTELTMTIDDTPPTLTISASPSWVNENSDVSVTVESSEPLASLDNVLVRDGTDDATEVSVTPNADNTVWTGTFTTGDNEARDGAYDVVVNGATDEYNNSTDNTELGAFNVDRRDPSAVSSAGINNWPEDANGSLNLPASGVQTDITEFFLEDTAVDNFMNADNYVTVASVNVKVGGSVTSITPPTQDPGYWTYDLELSEGKQVVGVQVVDKAGNTGPWTLENVTVDTTAPTISVTSPSDGALLNDNEPMISVDISDETIGIENADFNSGDNSGYLVQLWYDNNTPKENLTPATSPDEKQFNSFTFENQLSALSDNIWKIYVEAGDNIQSDNIWTAFEIDTKKPDISELKNFEGKGAGKSRAEPKSLVNQETITIEGDAPVDAVEVKIYVNNELQKTVELESPWTAEVSLTEGLNKIEVSAVDAAGNETDRKLFGYVDLTVDTTSPTVSISDPKDGATTGNPNIKLTVSVSDEGTGLQNVSISAPGYTVPSYGVINLVSDGQIVIDVPLTEGSNTITVTATDRAGNPAGSDTITVTRTVERAANWAMYATFAAIIAIILATIAVLRRQSE